jgi:hypothetical protein
VPKKATSSHATHFAPFFGRRGVTGLDHTFAKSKSFLRSSVREKGLVYFPQKKTMRYTLSPSLTSWPGAATSRHIPHHCALGSPNQAIRSVPRQ